MAATAHDGDRTACFKVMGVAVAILFFVFLIMFCLPLFPSYAVSIDSVSGLDVTAPDLALNPQFNLTLRVNSQSFGRSGCMRPGTYVEVSYRCVLLAASGASPERICAEPHRSRDVPVVARGAGVHLPGYMMEGLAADLRNGVHAFEIAVKLSNGEFDDALLATCKGRQAGGDSTAALDTTCNWSNFCPDHDPRIRRFVERSMRKHISSLSKSYVN